MGTEARDRLKATIESTKDFDGCVYIPPYMHVEALLEEIEEDPYFWDRQEWRLRLDEHKHGKRDRKGVR